MTVKVQHKDGKQTSSQVTVSYDGRRKDFEIDENGIVEVENKQEVEYLLESHGEFEKVDDSEPGHVLSGKTVDEVEKYVRDIEDLDRLKELRKLEDRKTGTEVIDDRIEEVKSEEGKVVDADFEEVEQEDDGNQEENEGSEEEDGTENDE